MKAIIINRVFITLFLLFSVITCFGQKYELKTNGLYRSKKTDDGYWYYLKFYNDKSVIAISSTGKSRRLKKWFNRENKNIPTGKYNIERDSISFFVTSSVGTVLYSGDILKNSLQLHVESQINGRISNERYKFKKNK